MSDIVNNPMDIQQTLADLATLPVDDRLRIVQFLWDSIPPDTEVTVSLQSDYHDEALQASHEPQQALPLG